ncbi:hypothetical protein CMT41_16695 [Colwellia sp. MT41]|uniref:hypothetical protein n=1 Tax=Colwellia sp. MT41 TaxID=58049 RepID=UPI0007177BFE|nr:hypothetical protein [Colwellia sp. MT41]ALO36185.1 hypothetical protein CMT41_16695 [Colwellia sp. MT41]
MKYKIPGYPAMLALVLWFGQQWIIDDINTKYIEFPWRYLFLALLIFMLGVAYADLLSKYSKLGSWIRTKRRIFDVDHFVLASSVTEEKPYLKATCALKFIKSIKNVKVSVQITSHVTVEHAKDSFILFQDEIGTAEPNLTKKYVFATFPRQYSKSVGAGYPYWGEDQSRQWAGDGTHVITLKARSFLRYQEEHFLMSAIRNPGGGPEPVLLFGGSESKKYMEVYAP